MASLCSSSQSNEQSTVTKLLQSAGLSPQSISVVPEAAVSPRFHLYQVGTEVRQGTMTGELEWGQSLHWLSPGTSLAVVGGEAQGPVSVTPGCRI